jgi:hypothetical protein
MIYAKRFFKISTKLNNCWDKCPNESLFGEKPNLFTNMKAFGEMGIVTAKDKILHYVTN